MCPAGTYGLTSGLTSASCSGVCTPVPGRYCPVASTSAGPLQCPIGQYSPVGALLQCGGAPAGTFVSATGGSTAVPCGVGQYSLGGAHMCTPCPPGTFGNSTGLQSSTCSGRCSAAAGSFCGSGMVNSSGQLCPAGYYSDSAGAAACTPCMVGRFGLFNVTGLSSSACSGSCPAGKYAATAASTVCTGCPIGTYASGGGAAVCTPCPAGVYGSAVNLTNASCSGPCYPIAGRYCGAGAVVANGAVCAAGQYRAAGDDNSTCSLCPPGSSSALTAITSVTQCNGSCLAVAGQFCGPGSAIVVGVSCPFGSYSPSSASACTPCAAGQFAGFQASTACTVCPAGKYSGAGAKLCSSCPAGTYSSSGAPSCSPCSSLPGYVLTSDLGYY